MKHFSGYGAYLLFLALRTHFTQAKYDFFQMNGKLRANKDSYLKRRDKQFFEKMAREYTTEDLRDFYVANLLEDKQYITELLDEDARIKHTDYIRRRQSLSYNYSNDLERLFDKGIKDSFDITDNSYPRILLLFLNRKITIESMVILNDFIPYSSKFDKYLGDDDIIWSRVALKLRKYRPFIKYDAEKFKAILKEKVDEDTRGKRI